MGAFDRAARYATQSESIAVIGRILRIAGRDLRFREWIDTRATPKPEERDQTADRVAVLDDPAAPARPVLLLLEFQAEHDPDKIDDTLAEVGQLRRNLRHGDDRQGKYSVLAALIYLRGRCPEPVLDMTGPGNLGTRHAPVVWNVAGDVAAEALDAFEKGETTWGILFFVALMQGGGDPVVIRRWRERVALLPAGRRRDELVGIALVFAELAGCAQAWQRELEGSGMTESAIVNSWVEKAQLNENRNDLLIVLRTRFKGAVPPEVVETINSQPSKSLLEDWLREAVTVQTIDEFIAFLRR
jgi:hypothetical protein